MPRTLGTGVCQTAPRSRAAGKQDGGWRPSPGGTVSFWSTCSSAPQSLPQLLSEPLTHLLAHSLTCTLTRSFRRILVHARTHSLTHPVLSLSGHQTLFQMLR